jgi:hypothetical protein
MRNMHVILRSERYDQEGKTHQNPPGDFRERLHEGSCIHASLKDRPLPIFELDDGIALSSDADFRRSPISDMVAPCADASPNPTHGPNWSSFIG